MFWLGFISLVLIGLLLLAGLIGLVIFRTYLRNTSRFKKLDQCFWLYKETEKSKYVSASKNWGQTRLVKGIRWFFGKLVFVRPVNFIKLIICLINPKWYRRNNKDIVDFGVASVLAIEIMAFLGSEFYSSIPNILGVILFSWFLLSIFTTWFDIFILKDEPGLLSPTRSLILALVNLFEIIFIFAILAFILRGDFHPNICSNWQSLRYSIGVITTIGSDFEPYRPGGYLLFYFQLLFGVLFLVVIIGRVLSYFPGRKS